MFGKVCIIAIVDHKENLQVCFQSVNLGNIARSNNPKKRVCFCWVILAIVLIFFFFFFLCAKAVAIKPHGSLPCVTRASCKE